MLFFDCCFVFIVIFEVIVFFDLDLIFISVIDDFICLDGLFVVYIVSICL
jgi:hypothetical protein